MVLISDSNGDAPDRYEIAARMRYDEGLPWRVIAERLSIPERTMRRMRASIRADMRIALQILALIRGRRNGYDNAYHKKNVIK